MTRRTDRFRALSLWMAACASTVLVPGCGGDGGSPAGQGTVNTVAAPAPGPTVSIQFTASAAEIANPERGFYRWAWTDLDQFTAADGSDAYANGYRVLYAMVRLDAYKNGPLPTSLLDGLRTGFGHARQAGVKIIPRFVYNNPASETEYLNATDASLSRVLGHIAQLKPVLQAHADVVAYLQAGFIGAWGEWHTSSNHLTDVASRTSIRDALLDALPPDHFVQFRYPPYVMAWFPTPPTASIAFDGSAASRSGLHNDCFLASTTDVGTFSDDAVTRQQQRAYAAAVAKVAPFGAETCNPADEPGATPRDSCADILAEGSQFSLTYLNDGYYTPVFHDRWKRDGCYDEVKRLMGYRLELVSAVHPASATAGQALTVGFTVRNVGWARPYKARRVALLLRHRGSGQLVTLATSIDPRGWTAGGRFDHEVSVTLPAGTPAGDHDVYIALPDGADLLAGDARFAVRPANADDLPSGQGWDAALGAFRFGSVLTVE